MFYFTSLQDANFYAKEDSFLGPNHDLRSFFPEARQSLSASSVHASRYFNLNTGSNPAVDSIFEFRADNRNLAQILPSSEFYRAPEKESVLGFDHSDLNQDTRSVSYGPTIASPFGSMETEETIQKSRRASNAFIQDSFHSMFSGVRNGQTKNEGGLQAFQSLIAKHSESQSSALIPQPQISAMPLSRSSPEGTPPADASKHTEDSDEGHRRSYRQQTSELISKLDKLLDFRHANASSKRKKANEKRQTKPLLKPRARNVVLKLAAELIRRMQLDDQVPSLSSALFDSSNFMQSRET
jgi:hypothetical protein